jgi:hypothetical protein
VLGNLDDDDVNNLKNKYLFKAADIGRDRYHHNPRLKKLAFVF